MKLELKHLAAYLPFKLKIHNRTGIHTMVYTNEYYGSLKDENQSPVALSVVLENNYSLVLRPLSDLTKEIEHNGEKFVPIIELFKMRTQQLSDSIDKIYIKNDTAVLKLQKKHTS